MITGRGRCALVVGAGLSGLMAARELSEAGVETVVVERESRVGGHARTTEVDGYLFDEGPHILSPTDEEMGDLIRSLLGPRLLEHHRRAFVYHAQYDVYTRFPFQAHLHGLPPDVIDDCLRSLVDTIEEQKKNPRSPRNYDEWLRLSFGDAIAERFIIPYSTKVWTVPPTAMHYAWTRRRVPAPDVDRIIRGARSTEVDDVGWTATFWYPETGGIESLPRALAATLDEVWVSTALVELDVAGRQAHFDDGRTLEYDALVYSLPLAELPRYVRRLPPRVRRACGRLKHQGVVVTHFGVAEGSVGSMHWLYFYEDRFPFHRVSFAGSFSPANVPPSRASLSVEAAFSGAPPRDLDALAEATLSALRGAGVLDGEAQLLHVDVIEPAYPIYDLARTGNVELAQSWLRENAIFSVGRLGEWAYLDMDQAMASGAAAARAVLAEAGKIAT